MAQQKTITLARDEIRLARAALDSGNVKRAVTFMDTADLALLRHETTRKGVSICRDQAVRSLSGYDSRHRGPYGIVLDTLKKEVDDALDALAQAEEKFGKDSDYYKSRYGIFAGCQKAYRKICDLAEVK